jgi:ABC-type phosphate/phosphonate transport system ATPase subunit
LASPITVAVIGQDGSGKSAKIEIIEAARAVMQ